jgi:hypothetical protein
MKDGSRIGIGVADNGDKISTPVPLRLTRGTGNFVRTFATLSS